MSEQPEDPQPEEAAAEEETVQLKKAVEVGES
jgi:hypothetical protein